jgi:hypothetical protein
MELPERKSPTEALDVQRKITDILAGRRPVDASYPYVFPDYSLPFLHIGTEKQLFLDNFILDHLDGVMRVFPTAYRPERPVLEVGDLPWENFFTPTPTAAIHDPDDGKFKLWYVQSLTGDPFNTGQVLCYAESRDCLHWEKPLSDACLPYEQYRETNIVARDTAAVTVVLNHDRGDPARKFLMLSCPYGRARAQGHRIMSTVAASPDGLRWTTISEDSSLRHQHEQRIIWDEAIRKWVGYSQYSHHWDPRHHKRQIGRQESDDFIHWSPKEVVLSADWDPMLPPHLEFHEMSARKVGGLYIGIAGEFLAEPFWCVRDGANWRDQAHVRMGLYCSRDGRRWQRVGGPEAWAANRGPGSIDYGYACCTAAGQLEHDGKCFIPYLAGPTKQHWYSSPSPPAPSPIVPTAAFAEARREWETLTERQAAYPGRRAVGMLILREDGWAALEPSYEDGRVYTRQFVFEGDALRISADCIGGNVTAEILDPYFEPYPGFSEAECEPVAAAEPGRIWHGVRWRGDADLRRLWNMPCRLRFHLRQASLYAFQFVSEGRP